MYYLCTAKSEQGTLAERLGNGLQNRVEQFDSARYLDLEPRKTSFRGSFIIHTSCCHSPTKLFAYPVPYHGMRHKEYDNLDYYRIFPLTMLLQ